MRHLVVATMTALLAAASASAQSMNAETFHKRATALQKKGALAIFSGGEIKALTGEAKAAGQYAGEHRRAAIKAGQKPRFCPPEGPVSMNNKEFMAALSAIPVIERQMIDMTEAMTRILARRHPCPSA